MGVKWANGIYRARKQRMSGPKGVRLCTIHPSQFSNELIYFYKENDSFIMIVYIMGDIYTYIYMHMIQSNSHSSTVWSTQDITHSQQDWCCPKRPVV